MSANLNSFESDYSTTIMCIILWTIWPRGELWLVEGDVDHPSTDHNLPRGQIVHKIVHNGRATRIFPKRGVAHISSSRFCPSWDPSDGVHPGWSPRVAPTTASFYATVINYRKVKKLKIYTHFLFVQSGDRTKKTTTIFYWIEGLRLRQISFTTIM